MSTRTRLASACLACLFAAPVLLWPRAQGSPAQESAQKPEQKAAEQKKDAKPAAAEEKKAPDFSQEAFVLEEFTTRARFESDGTGRSEVTARVRVQSDAGVQQLGELSMGYNAANQKLQIEYVRVRKADGSVVTAGPDAIQDLSAPFTREAPVYTDYRLKRISVPGLRPGETLEYKTITLTETPLAPGNFWLEYDFEKRIIVLSEVLEVNVPRNRAIQLKTRPEAVPVITEEGDRKIYRWKSQNLERPSEDEQEKKKKPKKEQEGPAIQLTTFKNWQEVGNWYAGLEKDRVLPTPEIRMKAAELVKGKTSDIEKIEGIYDYVARNFRYVSLSFGVGRYQPHPASEVLANQYGDCKDKHTLLASLLDASGLHAEAVLISSQRKLQEDVPSPSQFDHVISRIVAGKDEIWLDTTTEVAPFRLLSANLRNKKALLIAKDGAPRLLDTPADPPFASSQLVEIEGQITELGKLKAHVKYTMRGDTELLLRLAFRRTPRNQWKQIAQWLAISDGMRGEVNDVKTGDPAATKEPFWCEYEINVPGFFDWSSKRAHFPVPLPTMGLPPGPSEEQESEEDKIEFGSALEVTTRLRLQLPANLTPRAPVAIGVMRDYAEYRSVYKLEPGVLRAERVMSFRLRDIPASRAGDYRAFQNAVRNDEGQEVSVENAAAGTSPGAPAIPESAKADEINEAGNVALNNQNYSAAVELFKRVTSLEPKHKYAWNNLGQAYMGLQNLNDAIAAFKKQIEVNPFDQFAHNNLGRAYWQQQKYDEAEAAFKKQIELAPLDKVAHANLGMMYRERKRYAEAAFELEKALTLTPNVAIYYVSLGQSYLNLGETQKAMDAFDKGVELMPAPAIWNNVAYELTLKNVHLDRAQQYAESAVAATAAYLRNIQIDRIGPNDLAQVSGIAAYWDTLGWVHFQRGNMEKAERFVRASWMLDGHGEVADHLGQIYEKLGRKQDATRAYAQALSGTRPVPETRGRLAALLGGENKVDALKLKYAADFSEQMTLRLGKLFKEKIEADFLIVLSPPPAGAGDAAKVEEVKFLKGSDKLRAVAETLKNAKFPVLFPDDTPMRLLRRGTLTCLPESECIFVLLPPERVTSLN